jgi:rod shape determining protein RodA
MVAGVLVFNLIDAPNWLYIAVATLSIGVIGWFSRTKIAHIILIGLIAFSLIGGLIAGWNYGLTNYQKTRIETFLAGPESDPTGSGYQVIQSKIAIGSGMFLGRGFLQGTQSSLNVLTQAFTDFVFAAFAEQFGFVGTVIVLVLYLTLIIRVIKTGTEASSNFGKYVALGIALLLLLQVFINIGMNLGKLPVTGITLPLMSYGGSSILMTMICLGLVQSINTSRKSVDIADDLMLISHSLVIKEK